MELALRLQREEEQRASVVSILYQASFLKAKIIVRVT